MRAIPSALRDMLANAQSAGEVAHDERRPHVSNAFVAEYRCIVAQSRTAATCEARPVGVAPDRHANYGAAEVDRAEACASFPRAIT